MPETQSSTPFKDIPTQPAPEVKLEEKKEEKNLSRKAVPREDILDSSIDNWYEARQEYFEARDKAAAQENVKEIEQLREERGNKLSRFLNLTKELVNFLENETRK